MSGPNDRIITAISTKELERRWAAARKEMRERGIDALVMQNNSDWLGGYVKWFTDIPATNGYPKTVVFHANEPMTMVEMGGFNTVRNLKGVRSGAPRHRRAARLALVPRGQLHRQLPRRLHRPGPQEARYGTIGLVGPGSLPHAFVMRLKESLPGAKFVDATEFIDLLKAIKSAEEIVLIKQCCEMQDAIFAKVAAAIKPGMRDIDVTGLAEYEGRLLGSEQGIFLGSSAPVGQPARFAPRHFQGRTLQKGDHLVLLIENNGPGGYYAEIARTLVLGKASNEIIDGFEAMREAQDYTLSLMKPGALLRRHRQGPRRLHEAARLRARDPALRPQPGLRHGRAADAARRRDHAARGEHELRRASRLQHLDDVDDDLRQLHGRGQRRRPCLHKTEKKIFEIN